jgi:hypothetical protein
MKKLRASILATLAMALLSACGAGSSSPSAGTITSTGTSTITITTTGTATNTITSTTTNTSTGGKTGVPVISGLALYEKLVYDKNGLTGSVFNQPIRYAKVEVVQNGVHVVTGSTDANGNYSVSAPGSGGSIFVRVYTDTASPFSATVSDGSGAMYSVRSPESAYKVGDSVQVNLLASKTDTGPAFNILDDLIRAQDVDNSLAGGYPQKIIATWFSGNTDGTYYNQGTGKITILGATTDAAGGSDAYDDAVILHEMGHYTAANFSKDESPGGQHSIIKHYPDLRLTWSEGWATFFSSMSRSMRPITASLEAPQWYIDTPGWAGLSGNTFAFEIDAPSYLTYATGADNELAVSNVLWHIFASGGASTTSPYLGLGSANIWSVFSSYLTSLPSPQYATLESFWDGWSVRYPQSVGQLTPILLDRKIVYSADQYESDNSIAQAPLVPVGMSENHTFFPAGDKDYFKVSVTDGVQYTFLTTVSNGADTMLTIFDSDGKTVLAQNDDIDPVVDPNNKASKIVWSANGTKTVYVVCEPYRVYTTADIFLYGMAGGSSPGVTRYGSYTISITSP